MLKLDESFRNQNIFIISFFNSSYLGFESKIFFGMFWHIFADPDPGSQNLTNPIHESGP